MNAIVGQAYINPAFISAQTESTSSTTGDYFLLLKSGGTLAKIVLDNLANSLAATTGFQSQIWSTRLRSFNAAGNCSFSVDQKTVGTGLTLISSLAAIQDRWFGANSLATGRVTAVPTYGNVALPGTSFYITDRFLRVTLTTAQASLAAGEVMYITQLVEGPQLRELLGDVHSISLLVRSSVAGLKFGCSLRDSTAATRSLCKLCTIPSANVWTLIPLPNLPIWDAGATWNVQPGNQGYVLSIALAAGTTYTAAAADIWQAGNFIAPPGMSNYAASAVNSTYDIAFIQHEPGAQATTLTDKPFTQSFDECLRYFQKTYPYATKPGTALGSPIYITTEANRYPNYFIPFFKPMAKGPTVTIYSPNNGASGNVYDQNAAVNRVGVPAQVIETGYGGVNNPAYTLNTIFTWHHTADTNW
jgi:hypothetical protein